VSVILAMGGGGFTMEPDNPALDDFILSLSGKREPRVLFLPTASGDPASQIAAFHERYGGRACRPSVLSLFRLHGSERTLREIVLAGLSAGAMCWFEGGVTRSSGPPCPIAGLGLLPGSLTVHADGEPERLPVWLESVRSGALPGGWAADDGVGLLFEGTTLTRVVSSRPGATAVRCDAIGGELVRRRIEPELLGAGPPGGRGTPDDVLELRALTRMRHELGASERLGDL
jgi:peptidase E